MKEKFELEYTINSSPKVLYNRLSTASGLSEWFADNVNIKKDLYIFIWDQSEQQSKILGKKDNKYIRFKWVDDEDDSYYFEFKIEIDDLTGDVALLITDFAEADEKDDVIDLWDTQVGELKRIIGL